MPRKKRVGLIVPSSNVTMETEIPEMVHRWLHTHPEYQVTFHSSRMRMQQVTPEELKAMDRESERCVVELSDSACDVLAYACLVAVMSQGTNYYREVEERLARGAAQNGHPAPVVSSAGALVRGLKKIGAGKVALVAPYLPAVTALVIEAIEGQGIEVVDSISLGVADNLAVARLDPERLLTIAKDLNLSRADAVVLSACVQMPSLPAVPEAERRLVRPVVTASIATTYEILAALGVEPVVPAAGYLMSGV